MATIDPERFVESAAQDGAEIGRRCREHPDRVVRSCPDWTGSDLLAHLAAFAAWMPGVLAGRTVPTTPPDPVAPDHWDAALDGLVDALRTTDADRPVARWPEGEGPARAWMRRVAQEFAVHRWDAATLLPGEPEPVPADLAHDGVEEFFDVFVLSAIAAGLAPPSTVTMVLELTDVDAVVRRDLPDPGPETVLRGTASELLLAVWGRRSLLTHHVAGDRAPLDAWPRM